LEIKNKRGNPPNLDVFVENAKTIITIESKCCDIFADHKIEFSDTYTKLENDYRIYQKDWYEGQWWNHIGAIKNNYKYLDVALLIKHYIGILEYKKEKGVQNKKAILLYLFWEPGNFQPLSTEVDRLHVGATCKSELT